MPEYRFYTIKKDGHIDGPPTDHAAPDDYSAVKVAKELINGAT